MQRGVVDMKLDLRRLKGSPGERFSIDSAIVKSSIEYKGSLLPVTKPISISVSAFFQSGALEADLQIDTEVEIACSRCLTAIRQPIALSESLEFIEEPKDGISSALMEEYSFEFGAKELDLMPFIEKLIAAAIEVKPLCRPECKGLCATCGKDLNTGKCGCADASQHGDPRMQQLKKLLSSKESS